MTTFILDGSMPMESVNLGRLVKNVGSPHEDYYEPSPAPEVKKLITEVENFRGRYESDHSKDFLVKLTQFTAFGHSRRRKVVSYISTKCARQYVLDNSKEYYRSIIQGTKTRSWIERALKEGDKICLLVGFTTFQDAVVYETDLEYKGSNVTLNAPVSTVVGAIAPVPGLICSDLLDTGLEIRVEGAGEMKRRYETKGEQVFALQYRRVKIHLLNSRDLDSALRESQWKVLTKHRFAYPVDTNDIIDSSVGAFEFESDDEEKEEWEKVTDENGDEFYL